MSYCLLRNDIPIAISKLHYSSYMSGQDGHW